MKTIIVTDIFGKTQPLTELASLICQEYFILDPYNGKSMNFLDEQMAYRYFSENVGLNEYTYTLKKLLANDFAPVRLVGFSAGASAIWNISNEKAISHSVKSATCYYGSQIRNNKNITPLFPIELIFPIKEEHFSIGELIASLSNKNNVKIKQVNFLHGFMNKCSNNYSQEGFKSEVQAHAKCAI
jgi:dienelactone hydrolase